MPNKFTETEKLILKHCNEVDDGVANEAVHSPLYSRVEECLKNPGDWDPADVDLAQKAWDWMV